MDTVNQCSATAANGHRCRRPLKANGLCAWHLNPPKKKSVGRPSDYIPDEHPRIVRSLCLLGATNAEIAAALGKGMSTIDRWLVEHQDFRAAVHEGRMHADAVVATSLFRRATGFKFESVKIFIDKGQPVYAPYTEVVHSDVTACIFWLKNRRPDLWRDAHRHELTGKGGAPVEYREVDAAMKDAAAELKVWREETAA